MRFTLLAGVLPVILACSNGSDSQNHMKEGEDDLAAIEGIPWKDLNHEQRGTFMRLKVLPRMSDVLFEVDPEEFQIVGCKTCHGQNAAARNFEMPSGDIKALNWNQLPDDPIVELMGSRVVPEMAALLEMQPFDPGTGEGEFSCANCHQIIE